MCQVPNTDKSVRSSHLTKLAFQEVRQSAVTSVPGGLCSGEQGEDGAEQE